LQEPIVSLYAQLQVAKSEEDVKDAYIKALGLKGYTKGLIDIQTNEIWFEAKDTGKHSSYAMFTQLLHYVQVALNKGEQVPPFLAVIDTEKAAMMKSADVLPFLAKKTVKWGKSASQYTQEALDTISAHIGTHFVSFKISTHEEEFIATVKAAIKSGDIIRTQITPDNLKQVFDKWVLMIGREIKGVPEEDYALLFFADIMQRWHRVHPRQPARRTAAQKQRSPCSAWAARSTNWATKKATGSSGPFTTARPRKRIPQLFTGKAR
jgi:hypothetical protein